MVPRRILYVENGSSGGGSFASLTETVLAIDRIRYDPVVAFVNRTPHADRLRAAGIPVFVIDDAVYSMTAPPLRRRVWASGTAFAERAAPWAAGTVDRLAHRSAMRTLARIIARERIALLHANDQSVRDFAALAVAGRLGIPAVSHLRSMRIRTITAGRLRVLHRVVRRFIANSNAARDAWVRFGLDPARVSVIPNGIPLDPVTPVDVHGRWGIPAARRVVGCVGNLTAGKGQEFFLAAFAELQKRSLNVHALIVGDGPARTALEADAMARRLTGTVTFTGYVTDAAAVIAGCSCLVLPSATETFGRTLLEAMVGRTPVVATNVGGIPEVVTDGENGLLVAYGDVPALTRAMERMCVDGVFADACVARGAAVVERFDIRHHVAAIAGVYDEVLRV